MPVIHAYLVKSAEKMQVRETSEKERGIDRSKDKKKEYTMV